MSKAWKFPVEVDPATGRVRMVEGDDAVRQSVSLIVGTERGERIMQPHFGARVNRFMFRGVDAELVTGLSREVRQAVELWEERAQDVDVEVVSHPGDATRVSVEIDYHLQNEELNRGLRLDVNLATGERS